MNGAERDRYSRQVLFQGIGEAGQAKLGQSRVAVVGCGALGSFQAGALARSGVAYLRLIDRDYVEWSNLQRQWLYTEEHAREALPKAVAAAREIGRIHSGIQVEAAVDDLVPDNAEELLGGVDLILDGTDNFDTRYLMNDFAVQRGVPWVYGGAVGSYGVVMPVLPGRSACFECLYPEPPAGEQPTCETAGVVNTVTAMVASWQVSFALRLLVEGDAPRVLLTMDVWQGSVRQLALPAPQPGCGACGLKTCRHLHGTERIPISLCGRNAVQIHDRRRPIDLEALARKLRPLGEVATNGFALRFVQGPYELMVFPDGRAIVKGTTDPAVARSLYARFIGN